MYAIRSYYDAVDVRGLLGLRAERAGGHRRRGGGVRARTGRGGDTD